QGRGPRAGDEADGRYEQEEGRGMSDVQPFRTGDTPLPEIVILTHKLTRDYDMGGEVVRALRGINIQIRKNEFVAVMGPSGSGKSTLMNLIGCLDTPTAGEYWLNGQKVSDLSDDELARIRNKEIGFVFQTFNLLPRANALHNVELPLIYAGLPGNERRAHAPRQARLRDGLAERDEQTRGWRCGATSSPLRRPCSSASRAASRRSPRRCTRRSPWCAATSWSPRPRKA